MEIKNCKPIRLKFVNDGVDGNLVIAEAHKQIPIAIKRVYFINNLNHRGAIRGKHAHRKLEQVLLCIKGSFTLGLDDGERKEQIIMDKSHVGVYMGPGVWHTMRGFSSDCVILVLASDVYKESDYIRDYDEFLRFARSKMYKKA